MIALVRGWLLCVTGAAVLAALAEALMPEGSVKQVGKLVCGLVLILAVLQPLQGGDATDLSRVLEYDRGRLELYTQQLQQETDSRMKKIIEEEMSAYSMDKATQAGVECQISVICRQEEGIFLPVSAQVEGLAQQGEYETVSAILTAELGIPESSIACREVSAP